jgi:hypothetical protein
VARVVSSRTLRREIDAAVRAGRTLEEIDSEILAPCALNEDTCAAVWLYAWGCLEGASGSPAAGERASDLTTR